MRITLVTPGFSASEQDWCIPCLWDFVRSLAAEHEVTVISLRYPSARRSYRVHGARVVALGGEQVRGWRRIPFLLRAIRQVEREVRTNGCDVLHALWAHEPGFVGAQVAARCGLPLLVSLLGGEWAGLPDIRYGGKLSRTNRAMTRRALAKADLVSTGSLFLDEIARGAVAGERRKLLPQGVDLDRFQADGAAVELSGRPILLRVGSLTPVKNPLVLVEAFASLEHSLPEAHLHFVGDGELREAVEERAREVGVACRVVLHGEVGHECLPAYYRAADLAVSCSRFESQAMVILEAAACGVPTVGSAVGCLPELVGEELLWTGGDEKALAKVIEGGLGLSAEWRSEFAKRVRQRYGLQRTTSDWLAAYRALSSSTGPTTRKLSWVGGPDTSAR